MIRMSEMVLPGHPDKFCDQVADAIIAHTVDVDPQAYGQVEVATWSDQVWLSGGVCTSTPLKLSMAEIVVQTGQNLGYRDGNWIDASKYQVNSTVCELVEDPRKWSRKVNDQAIVVGWAGYDDKTAYLPPEHFASHAFREALAQSCQTGVLKGQGPDGKLLVVMTEDARGWRIETLLITLQQLEGKNFVQLTQEIECVAAQAYAALQEGDARWVAKWTDVSLKINPNGPLTNGGSDGDNGQTGRKLAMDYYGPRVPQGGGALCGKHLTHIDRIGSYTARQAAVHAVQTGAKECLIKLAYAPNLMVPMEASWEVDGRCERVPLSFFNFEEMCNRYSATVIDQRLAQGRHFFDTSLPWNGPIEAVGADIGEPMKRET
jgi:S-adenosylmethionine synthetase